MHLPASQVNVSFNGVKIHLHIKYFTEDLMFKKVTETHPILIIIISLHITLYDLKKTKGSKSHF